VPDASNSGDARGVFFFDAITLISQIIADYLLLLGNKRLRDRAIKVIWKR
jgi:hypothetical protein